MRLGEFLTRSSIWLTLAGYFVGSFLFVLSQGRESIDRIARLAWTFGCLNLVLHMISAFTFYHHWDQSAAYADTARQTKEVVGLDWGGGLYINYGILAIWIADTAWWWLMGIEVYRRRSDYLTLFWQALLFFIVFNSTVVFKDGAVRWIGLVLSFILVASWVPSVIRRSSRTATVTRNSSI